mmetsp:Transcript_5171/g.15131  ORF Transcript_5171/g.15131 Transcript_5171/m.15131 type:complete len:220 (+) Transcript_5171:1105-1764(+)
MKCNRVQVVEVPTLQHVRLLHHRLVVVHGEVLPTGAVIVLDDVHEQQGFRARLLQNGLRVSAKVRNGHAWPFAVSAGNVSGDGIAEAKVRCLEALLLGHGGIADCTRKLIVGGFKVGNLLLLEKVVGDGSHNCCGCQEGCCENHAPEPDMKRVALGFISDGLDFVFRALFVDVAVEGGVVIDCAGSIFLVLGCSTSTHFSGTAVVRSVGVRRRCHDGGW